MTMSLDDRWEIVELIHRHGHLFDGGDLARLDTLFTEDVVYDVSDFGQPPLRGIVAIRAAALELGSRNPVGHHVTNVVVTEAGDGTARALSKGLGVASDGSCASVTYDDTVVRTANGWRIAHRMVRAHRQPLGGAAE